MGQNKIDDKLNNFIYNNKFYLNFIDNNYIFKLEDFLNFIKGINELSKIYIKKSKIDVNFVSFLLDIESQLLMSVYEDKGKHKFLGISIDDGYQMIYDFIFFLIDFVSGKRKFDDFISYIYEEYKLIK